MDRIPPPGSKLMVGPTVEQKVAILEKRLATLEALLQAGTDGSLAIRAVMSSSGPVPSHTPSW